MTVAEREYVLEFQERLHHLDAVNYRHFLVKASLGLQSLRILIGPTSGKRFTLRFMVASV